jgi:hypothetical protein
MAEHISENLNFVLVQIFLHHSFFYTCLMLETIRNTTKCRLIRLGRCHLFLQTKQSTPVNAVGGQRNRWSSEPAETANSRNETEETVNSRNGTLCWAEPI